MYPPGTSVRPSATPPQSLLARCRNHRRLYVVDEAGVAHVLWLVCEAPARSIGACEQAQRTMSLVAPAAVMLPEQPTAAPAKTPSPWTFVMPAGYTESNEEGDVVLERLRKTPGIDSRDTRIYQSPDRSVRLLILKWHDYRGEAPTWADLDTLDRALVPMSTPPGASHVSSARRAIGDQLVGEQVDVLDGHHFVERRLYGVARMAVGSYLIHGFVLACSGPPDRLSECRQAQESMRLELPDRIMPPAERSTPAAPTSSRTWRDVIPAALLVALLVGLTTWIYNSARRGARRRRRRP